LAETYSGLDLDELIRMIEWKTGLALGPADRQEVRRRYLRVRCRSWLPVRPRVLSGFRAAAAD